LASATIISQRLSAWNPIPTATQKKFHRSESGLSDASTPPAVELDDVADAARRTCLPDAGGESKGELRLTR